MDSLDNLNSITAVEAPRKPEIGRVIDELNYETDNLLSNLNLLLARLTPVLRNEPSQDSVATEITASTELGTSLSAQTNAAARANSVIRDILNRTEL